ncbi:hypothetical protein A5624_26680 [Mycobacterium sp. 1482292.6]|nr:hypothetical protein A5624_26680 [Mycobacterium sp. 1482292.6]OBJ16849.1 hypothetical protein A5622_24635 [Mycobacterium sp. 1245801.1]
MVASQRRIIHTLDAHPGVSLQRRQHFVPIGSLHLQIVGYSSGAQLSVAAARQVDQMPHVVIRQLVIC